MRKAVSDENVDEIKAKMEELNKVMQAVSADLYAQAKSSAGPAGGDTPETEAKAADAGEEAKPGKDEGDVIDADFEMVDDKKK